MISDLKGLRHKAEQADLFSLSSVGKGMHHGETADIIGRRLFGGQTGALPTRGLFIISGSLSGSVLTDLLFMS